MEPNQNINTNTNLTNEPTEATGSAAHYIEAIKNLKANTVNRDEYQRLLDENKALVDNLVNNTSAPTEEAAPEVDYTTRIKDLRNELFGGGKPLDNLTYVTKTLELREAIKATSGEDIFVGSGHKISPTSEDYATADRVAAVFQECVEYAQGDSQIFTQELQRRTKDISLPRGRR